VRGALVSEVARDLDRRTSSSPQLRHTVSIHLALTPARTTRWRPATPAVSLEVEVSPRAPGTARIRPKLRVSKASMALAIRPW
jgi:hypothetical protein